MKGSVRFPLLAKVLGWLVLHLVILGVSFFLFVRWQLGLGLDSLISGAAGERLGDFGDSVAASIIELPPQRWNDVIKPLAQAKNLSAAIFDPTRPDDFPSPVPPNVVDRARTSLPPQQADPRPPRGGPGHPLRPRFDPLDDRPPPGFEDDPGPPMDFGPGPRGRLDGAVGKSATVLPKSRPAFLMRGESGDGYWAGVLVHLPPVREMPRRPVMLLLRAERLDGSGMFFNFKPWLWGGLAVLMLSLAFWTPFVWGITRYLRRLTAAADQISAGRFHVSLPPHGNDELGNLGRTIESMATRLDHFISGQKRFLGDAAHELCAPLARIRTGLGILEMKLTGVDSEALASIENDVAELAGLVNEILAFSRAGNRAPSPRPVVLEALMRDVLIREAADVEAVVSIPPDLTVVTDPGLLGRAVGNLIRNAGVHAGPRAKVELRAVETNERISISVADNGPGVPLDELPRIFEPFYRIDRSRSRDTGGSGLGLAIVRTAIEACGGETVASLPVSGGFTVTIHLPKQPTGPDGE